MNAIKQSLFRDKSALRLLVHFALVQKGFCWQHFAYPSAMFNHQSQCPERVEYPGVPISFLLNGSLYFKGANQPSLPDFLQASASISGG